MARPPTVAEGRFKTVQKLSVPPLPSDRVTLTIESSTEPGWTTIGRDAVLISEVGFGGPA